MQENLIKILPFLQFVTTQANGSLKVWCAKSENKQQNAFCLFLISQKAEHSAIILLMATLNKNKTIVTVMI